MKKKERKNSSIDNFSSQVTWTSEVSGGIRKAATEVDKDGSSPAEGKLRAWTPIKIIPNMEAAPDGTLHLHNRKLLKTCYSHPDKDSPDYSPPPPPTHTIYYYNKNELIK
jgi:hypothetical protein